MKAAVTTSYGPAQVVLYQERPKPAFAASEILIRVKASSISRGDVRIRSLTVPGGFGLLMRLAFGWSRPRQPVLGTELSGIVEAVGAKVDRFSVGDRIFGLCGMRLGGHAQYCVLPQNAGLARLPASLSWEEGGALAFGASTAVDFLLHRARLQAKERVLLLGASGSVGSAMIQIAKHKAAHVTAVCSGDSEQHVMRLGADRVINYETSDPLTSPEQYDVVVDAVGTATLKQLARAARPGGRVLPLIPSLGQMLGAPLYGKICGRRFITGAAGESPELISEVAQLSEQGVLKPALHQVFELAEVQAAHQVAEKSHKQGSVVLTMP